MIAETPRLEPHWDGLRVIKVIDAPQCRIIDETGAFSAASAKLIKNCGCPVDCLGHTHKYTRTCKKNPSYPFDF
jgi:hypothetical protein